MKRKDFEELRMLRQELSTLEKRLEKMPASEQAGDTYGDYRTGHKHIRVMYGASSQRRDSLIEKMEKKAAKLAEKIEAVEDELDSIDDSTIRDICRLYYQDGLSEEAIGEIKGYSRSAISTKLNNFWADKV